ncbi:hypothetical protein Cfor_01748 [Coptotermes formosanus]|uniref:Uncharacterized protein n=1 Tax=Coptotermes formosanus TaxID=36987 RepID=A0A6L2PB31_COPFO|nr:hypothetical protein Cfor_01748 [Coptotermes formosanus]
MDFSAAADNALCLKCSMYKVARTGALSNYGCFYMEYFVQQSKTVIDEIALEGLDGITLEGLWTRLSCRPNFTCTLDEKSKTFIWNIIRQLNDIEMYELPTARKSLVIFNRYDNVDPELGMILEPSSVPEDIYPHCPVEDNEKKVMGSCSTWDSKLALVATQDARNTALMGLNVNPGLELTIMQYCVLERIGRSRYMGEVTQGKVSLQLLGEDPKALFYHRKFLIKHKLIVKQVHQQKTGTQNSTGSLLHLPRFQVERKPKALFLTEKVIEILKTRENCLAEYEEIRKELGLSSSLKKLFKTFDFQRYVKTDLWLPYRQMYPLASVSEWKHKGSDREKKIRAIQLINPDMDVREIWIKDDDIEDDDDTPPGLLDTSELLLDRSILSQAFNIVENAGPEGVSQMELSVKMGVCKLRARTLCRNLLKKGVLSTFMNDVGRQRVYRYMSKKFVKEGKMSVEFMREKEKMLTLVGHKRDKKQSKNKGKSKKVSSSKEDDNVHVTKKRLREEGTAADSGLDLKKMKVDTDETAEASSGEELASPEEPLTDAQAAAVEQKIETRILEDVEYVPGIKEHQASFTEELLKMDPDNKDIPNITYRLLRRANIIIEAVRTHKVIDDLTKLMKHISEEEDKEGYNVKIDKKSLVRLLVKLSRDGHVKVIKIVLKGGTKEKVLSFVCEPDITTDHSIIQSAIEQAKMKFFILGKDRLAKLCSDTKEKENRDVLSESMHRSCDGLKTLPSSKNKFKTQGYAYDSRVGKKYGFSPKFVRMQVMHQFLFYLIYGYTGSENLDQAATINRLRQRDDSVTDEIAEEMATVYGEDVDWKMFVPPLPTHAGWPKGWAIMCDLLLRLPLCLFVKVFNVSFIIPELEQYLMHPIRRHYLIRHLPSHLRNILIIARRYIYGIHEVMQRLCYVGLIQFGPQRLKEKDQVFVFLNRKATLLDTTPSRPGYHQVSEDMTYTEHKYEFHTLDDVDKYWYEMWNFCIHTQLGGRMCVTGKDIVLEVLQNKQVMIEAIQPRLPEEAAMLDTGAIPGDKRGAAGLDSAFFSHLKRNWNWANATACTEAANNSNVMVKPQEKSAKAAFPAKKRLIGPRTEAKKDTTETRIKGPKKRNFVRHVLPRKTRGFHKPYYDEVDMKALQLMSKLRVEWSTTEDNLLLLCKVASTYLCPIPRKQIINFQMIRDCLHQICPSSQNKTSRACQRRILYMMKNPATAHSVALHLEDVRQDPNVIRQFGNTIQELRSKTDDIEELEKMANERFKGLLKPNAISCSKQYDLVYPSPTIKKRGRFQDVKNVVDIYCAVVNAIIHSSLCCVTDKTSYTYQLFQVYQQYPDSLLRSAMAKIRSDQMVSMKKSYMRLKQKTGNYLPVSSSPYQLSISYVYQLQSKYQHDIFYKSYSMVKKMCTWYAEHVEDIDSASGVEAAVTDGGTAAALVELFTRKQISFEVEIPEQVIILDPRVSEKDETYARIVQRYRDILQLYKVGKELATSSLIFKRPYMDLVGAEEVWSKEGDLPSGSKDTDADQEDGDPDDYELDTAEDVEEQSTNINQQTAIARAATRIALYMMREELGDAMLGEKQHAHDFFVVNSCKVYCKVKPPSNNKLRMSEVTSSESNSNENKQGSFQVDTDQNTTFRKMSPCKTVEVSQAECSMEQCDIPVLDEQSVNVSQEVCSGKQQEDLASRIQSGNISSNNQCHKSIEREDVVIDPSAQDKEDAELDTVCENQKGNTEGGQALKEDKGADEDRQHVVDVQISESEIENADGNENAPVTTLSIKDIERHVPESFLPITSKETKKVLEKIVSNLMVSDEDVREEEVESAFILSGAADSDWKKAKGIITYVMEKKEVGATMKEIRRKFRKPESVMSLAEVLALLTKSRILYRSGVTTVHYIYHMYMKPWLVHSYKLLRLEREKLVPPPQEAVINVAPQDSDDASEKQSGKTHERIRAWRRQRLLATAREVERAVHTLHLSGTEKIHVAIRPWVRVDGSLNRRVLDRMLGSVLGHCMYSPGVSIKSIAEHFSPALQPYQVRELIEVMIAR